MSNNTEPTREQITISQVAHHARILHLAIACGGQPANMHAYADALGYSASAAGADACVETMRAIASDLKAYSEAIENLSYGIDLASSDAKYKAPQANASLDAVPRWARDMIKRSEDDAGEKGSR